MRHSCLCQKVRRTATQASYTGQGGPPASHVLEAHLMKLPEVGQLHAQQLSLQLAQVAGYPLVLMRQLCIVLGMPLAGRRQLGLHAHFPPQAHKQQYSARAAMRYRERMRAPRRASGRIWHV